MSHDRKRLAAKARRSAQYHMKEANHHITQMFYHIKELNNYTDDMVEYEYTKYFLNEIVDYARLFYQTDRAVNRRGKDELLKRRRKGKGKHV